MVYRTIIIVIAFLALGCTESRYDQCKKAAEWKCQLEAPPSLPGHLGGVSPIVFLEECISRRADECLKGEPAE